MNGRSSPIPLVVLVLAALFSLLYVTSTQTKALPQTATVVIPQGASVSQSEHNNFEPDVIRVVIGINNTVSWVNHDEVAASVVADTGDDPAFAAATRMEGNANPPNFMEPGESFEFTFTDPGTFGYHSEPHPWMRASVVVLPRT